MVDRKQAFKQKVLKKLYSSPSLEAKIHESPTEKSRAKQEPREEERNQINGDSIDADVIPACGKVYTVSLPPSGYEVCSTRLKEQHESQDSSDAEPEGSKENYLIEMFIPLRMMIPGYIRLLQTRAASKVTLNSTDTLLQRSALLLGLLGFSMSYYSTRQMHLQQKSVSNFKTGT
uniref:uncharacterized protein n=1 Tax=Pristiophorus japonicus TaxID=55135 RepID=UPI00398F191B